jgi:hypothetical protein
VTTLFIPAIASIPLDTLPLIDDSLHTVGHLIIPQSTLANHCRFHAVDIILVVSHESLLGCFWDLLTHHFTPR